jgi:hypothetical protein
MHSDDPQRPSFEPPHHEHFREQPLPSRHRGLPQPPHIRLEELEVRVYYIERVLNALLNTQASSHLKSFPDRKSPDYKRNSWKSVIS